MTIALSKITTETIRKFGRIYPNWWDHCKDCGIKYFDHIGVDCQTIRRIKDESK